MNKKSNEKNKEKELTNSDEEINSYQSWIGQTVEKISGKPFKSSFKKATVKEVILHPILHKAAFLFEEDESYVASHLCFLSTPSPEPLKKSSPLKNN